MCLCGLVLLNQYSGVVGQWWWRHTAVQPEFFFSFPPIFLHKHILCVHLFYFSIWIPELPNFQQFLYFNNLSCLLLAVWIKQIQFQSSGSTWTTPLFNLNLLSYASCRINFLEKSNGFSVPSVQRLTLSEFNQIPPKTCNSGRLHNHWLKVSNVIWWDGNNSIQGIFPTDFPHLFSRILSFCGTKYPSIYESFRCSNFNCRGFIDPLHIQLPRLFNPVLKLNSKIRLVENCLEESFVFLHQNWILRPALLSVPSF